MRTNREAEQVHWPEAMAEVTECRYDLRAGRALAFGLPSGKHFRITYNYLVDGELHTGQCFSEKVLPQGTLFPLQYDPDLPSSNRSAMHHGVQRVPLLAIGLAGSLVLTLLWFLWVRGCS